jgi:hypothetical protein
MKNFFRGFAGISALALLLAGCDDGTSDPNSADPNKPDATLPPKADAVSSGPVTCPIPASTMHKFGKVPTNGYLLLLNPAQFACSTYAWDAAPTACGSPVDGFAKTADDPACCVNVLPFVPGNGNPNSAKSAYVEVPSLICDSASDWRIESQVLGKTALCSSDGKFMGWSCSVLGELPLGM